MTLTELVTDAWLIYKGKSSSTPQAGSTKYTDIVSIANRKQRERAQDANIDWPDLYQNLSSGVVSTGVQDYNLSTSILRLTDYVYLNTTKIPIVTTPSRSLYSSGCYVHGTSPKVLTFITTIGTNYNGYTIYTPAIIIPTDLSVGTDIVNPVIAEWLRYAVAAELARNDYAKEEQYGNISGQANDLYSKLVADAQANSFLQPNGVVNAMPQAAGLDNSNYNPWGL